MTRTQKTDSKNIEVPDITDLILKHGSHGKRAQGMCLLEAVAWFAGEKHSDQPECVDRSLAAFGRSFNDRLRDDERQLLKPLIPKLIGTKGSRELQIRRAYLLVDRHLRVNMPAFLRALPHKPRPDLAERLEALPPVIDGKSAELARDGARAVRDEAQKAPRSYASAAAAAASAAAASADAAYAAYAADAADASAAAAAAAADAAYAADAADADAYAAYAYAAYAAAAAAAAYAAAYAAWQKLRRDTIERSIAAFEEAIALKELES